jgi:hypothetical protein
MRPRRGAPWKANPEPAPCCAGNSINLRFNAATEGNSVERPNSLAHQPFLGVGKRGFNAATEGNSVERSTADVREYYGGGCSPRLQCGHGGELRGKAGGPSHLLERGATVASMRPRRGTPWKGVLAKHVQLRMPTTRFNAATEGNSVESKSSSEQRCRLCHCFAASMRPRRGTPWKDQNDELTDAGASG